MPLEDLLKGKGKNKSQVEEILRQASQNHLKNIAEKSIPPKSGDEIDLGSGGSQKSAPPSE